MHLDAKSCLFNLKLKLRSINLFRKGTGSYHVLQVVSGGILIG